MAERYIAIFFIIYIVLFSGGYCFLRLVAFTGVPKKRIFDRACGENDRNPCKEAENDPWFFKIEDAEHFIENLGHLHLSAAFLKGKSEHRYVLLCHDYATDGRYTAAYARLFYERGFSLLIPDARACGKSTGKLLGLGFAERAEVDTWVQHIIKCDEHAEIWLFGLGTGAAAELFYTSDKPDKHVCGVIADSCYAGLWEVLLAHLLPAFGAVSKVIIGFANTEYMVLAGINNNWKKADLWHRIKNCHLPILLIHGQEDYLFPVRHFDVLREQIVSPLSTVLVSKAGHIANLSEDPQRYVQAVDDFFSQHGTM
jgi:uncharacterized protein